MHTRFLLLALLAGLSIRAQAYVTSALLEYTVDDQASFFLNGSPILERSNFCPFNFDALSTADGTLPMELFDSYGENELAVEDFDLEGYHMSISYRLTVHTSDGDPIVIWSDPGQAKTLHLSKEQKDPAGWTALHFDDSAWQPAVLATEIKGPFDAFAQLHDPAFGGLLGLDAYAPRLSHNFNMKCNTQDHNLFRSKFRFPDKPARVTALVNPPQGVAGQKIAVRLVPGPDSVEFSQFNLLSWVPQGMEVTSASPGSKWDPKLRRLSWSFRKSDLQVGYAKMPLQSILSASGWSSPAKALGPFKPGKGRRKLNTPDAVWNDGAVFTANRPGWFKLGPHGVDLSKVRPIILGVIFRSQMKLGGKDNANVAEADAVMFNYSVDGTQNGALKDDVEVSRMTANDYWFDGYYDASEDRHWTWEDLQRLAVKVEARARGTQDKNLLSSVVATVKYYLPVNASPYFFAQVTEPRCATLKLNTGVYRTGSPLLSSDPVDLKVNAALCPATPVPTPTFTPIPIQLVVAPTPEPPKQATDPGKTMVGENRFELGCLSASPEPFNYAGTFVSFCVKKDVNVTLTVYSASTGKVERRMKAGSFRPGDNQVFYNAQDENGKILSPGSYIFELLAEKDGHREVRNGTFEFVKKKR